MNNKNITVGLMAHVDAGKTTLSEAMLYLSGAIRRQGRVDDRSTLLDNYKVERDRGITVFSKQASFSFGGTDFYLVDTPGHSDFACETERTLSVLDCAVLVISGLDGVQSHTVTLYKLLQRYNVPCFIFVSKMDLTPHTRDFLLSNLKSALSDAVCDFTDGNFYESAAELDENALDEYLASGTLSDKTVTDLIKSRSLIPCVFGSGLKLTSVDTLLSVIASYMPSPAYSDIPSAIVYKIGRDERNERLTYVKITGGEFSIRQPLSLKSPSGEITEEKITGIRFYSGAKYTQQNTASAGQLCCFTGLASSFAGQGIGGADNSAGPVLEPVMTYRITLPDGDDPKQAYLKLCRLSEEDPGLFIEWNEQLHETHIRLMGKIQTEVLKALILDRFSLNVSFDSGRVIYRETINNTVEGVGHYEPLRHYAEVHLLLEPAPPGSGVIISSSCPTDLLSLNWQRLILTHIAEKKHLGVLTGSPLTDVKITLASGRAHEKHTEGGDFRQATYRAIRQGLMKAESVLLEPWYDFTLTVPEDCTGRAYTDLREMNAEFSTDRSPSGETVFTGSAPVVAMNEYSDRVRSYTHGAGRISLANGSYRPCLNAQEVIKASGYDPRADLENSPDSVFCAHGAGFNVAWDRVEEYMHLDSCLKEEKTPAVSPSPVRTPVSIDDKELEEIMTREFGPIRRPVYSAPHRNEAPSYKAKTVQTREHIIVDGYNVIFCWKELKTLAAENLDIARQSLIKTLSDYASFTKSEVILVFDGYRTAGSTGSREKLNDLFIVYTKEGELADNYIEGLVDEIGRNHSVRVISGDNLIRITAFKSGVLRTSSEQFEPEVMEAISRMRRLITETNQNPHLTRLKDGKN